jgi:hypothetical protein
VKTYASYKRCLNAQSNAFPVHCQEETRWAPLGSLLAMKPIEPPVAFAPRFAGEQDQFDRLFVLVSDHDTWGIQTILARGFPEPWPHIESYDSLKEARDVLQRLADQYGADQRWMQRT